MSVEKIIQKLEMVKDFDIKESYLDDYIKEQEKYVEMVLGFINDYQKI